MIDTAIAGASKPPTPSAADPAETASRPLAGRVTVAMITMNEEKAVAKVIGDIRRAVPEAEILIVDSSRDRTAEIARGLGAKVIEQLPPRGYGPAMDLALRSGQGEVVVTLDCDDTYPVEFIEPMARLVLDAGWDVVDGSRLAGKPAAMPWLNYVANSAFALIASTVFFRRIPDLHSGMRAYRKSIVAALRCEVNGTALPVELLLRPMRERRRVKIIDIPYRVRIGESTMRPLESAWWTLKRIWRSRFR
jgi:glycosyltransferase involved in cell wall biosynthesis